MSHSPAYNKQYTQRHWDAPTAIGLWALSNHWRAPGSPKLTYPAIPKSARVSADCGTSPATNNNQTITIWPSPLITSVKIKKDMLMVNPQATTDVNPQATTNVNPFSFKHLSRKLSGAWLLHQFQRHFHLWRLIIYQID
jgi:hypothetical protein